MKKIAISLVLAVVLLFTSTVPAFAASNNGNNGKQSTPTTITPLSYPLHQGIGPFVWKDYQQGTDFGINVNKGEDKFVPGFELGTEGTVLWHFVNPDKLGGYANITFLDTDGKEVTIKNVTSYKNSQHFAVVTVQSWKLLNVEYFPATAPNKNGTLFNLSHTAGKEQQQYGALKVTADVAKQHEEVIWQRYYERNVQDFYSRDVQDFYSRDVQDFYLRDVQDFYMREYYKRYVPVFEKKVTSVGTKTLTSRLGSNVGGIFNNGMVWLNINVEKARTEGYTIGMAQSNPDNTYIGYDYNVRIEDNKLIISFDNRFIKTQITAKVYSTPPSSHDNSGHITLGNGGTLTLDLPANYGDNVYLYVHFNNGIRWYTTGEYEFVEWRYLDTILEDYKVVKTESSDYKLVDTVYGDYNLINTVYGDYNLVDTVYGHYNLVETKEVSRKIVTDAYDAEFDLIIKNASGTPVYTSKIKNNSELIIPQLIPGKYTVILSSDDIGQQIKYADVVVSKTTEVNLGDSLTVIGEQVNKYLDNIKTDKKLDDVKTDNKLEDVKADNKLEDVRKDNKLPNVYLPDKNIPDVKLGNETDPYDVNSIRLN